MSRPMSDPTAKKAIAIPTRNIVCPKIVEVLARDGARVPA
jgi:hypothetical protein